MILTRYKSAATTNLTSFTTKPTKLYFLMLQNTSAAKKYVKLYNKATAPVLATDVPSMTIELQAGQTFNLPLTNGDYLPFNAGLAFAITGALADTDTTVVAANDVFMHIGHQLKQAGSVVGVY